MNKGEELAVAEALSQLRERKERESGREESDTIKSNSPGGEGETSSSPPHSEKNKHTMSEPKTEHTALEAPGTQQIQGAAAVAPAEGGPPPVAAADTQTKSSEAGAAPQPQAGELAPPAEPHEQQTHQWRSVLLTATSFVLSRDTRRKLRQLLKVLRLASEHLSDKVEALKQCMENDADADNKTPGISHAAIRNDIITTIKKCLAMLSTMATNTLPTAVCNHIRGTLLKLPARWADQLGDEPSLEAESKSESAVLALATETLVCIQNIINILADSVDRADSWVERLPDFLGKRRRADEESRALDDKEAAALLFGPEESAAAAEPESPAAPEAKIAKLD